MQDFFQQLIRDLEHTSFIEYIAVLMGIISVWFSKKENIWVFPTGLINTTLYIYLSFKNHLIGEASVNFYYTVMSIYGWALWLKKDASQHHMLKVTYSGKKEWMQQLLFFAAFYGALFFSLSFLKKYFEGAIPWAVAFASATAYTGMWLMAKKKVESWYWWIATNIASIPLYYVKGLAFTSFYYVVLLLLAVFGLVEWKQRANATRKNTTLNIQPS